MHWKKYAMKHDNQHTGLSGGQINLSAWVCLGVILTLVGNENSA